MTSFQRYLILFLFCLVAPFSWGQSSIFPKYEMRAVWLTTYLNLDWPKKVARNANDIEIQKQELRVMLDKLEATNINTVFFQVRMRGTTIYPSSYEPWDKCMTGISGRDPGYDPLAFAIEECHKRNMQLHAWMVSFPLNDFKTARSLGRKATSYKMRSLCKRGKDKWYLDPGIPATADYLADVVGEVVKNYDIDGIHLDYIRYPESNLTFSDYSTYRRYGKHQNIKDWRRDNVTRCVETIHHTIKNLKPWVCFSSAPVGKFTNLPRYSSFGWDAYNAVYQDAQKWLKDGTMDMLAPMMYFKGFHFYPFVLDWNENNYRRTIAPGLGIYFLDHQTKDWPLIDITRELYFLRSNDMSQAFFRVQFLNDNVKGLYSFLKDEFYKEPALVPPIIGYESEAPTPPRSLKMIFKNHQFQLSWEAPNLYNKDSGIYYRIYRDLDTEPDVTLHNTLLCDHLTDTTYSYNIDDPSFALAHFAVTAVDRFGNESAPALFKVQNIAYKDKITSTELLENNGSQVLMPPLDIDFIFVIDDTGRKLYTCRYHRLLDISKLSLGLYYFRSLNENGTSHIIGKTFVKR